METVKIDRIDRKILGLLAAQGRLTMQELGDAVGLSASPCARRVKRLEEAGVIAGYRAVLDERRLGAAVSVFVSVKLDKQVEDALRQFEAAVRTFPEVADCWLMTGSRDYLMRVATADLAAFEAFLTAKLTKVPGVAAIESSISLRRVVPQEG